MFLIEETKNRFIKPKTNSIYDWKVLYPKYEEIEIMNETVKDLFSKIELLKDLLLTNPNLLF